MGQLPLVKGFILHDAFFTVISLTSLNVFPYSAFVAVLVEVTRTDPLEKLVWTNKKDPDNERNKILNRTKAPNPG